jgi:hypothetical protein
MGLSVIFLHMYTACIDQIRVISKFPFLISCLCLEPLSRVFIKYMIGYCEWSTHSFLLTVLQYLLYNFLLPPPSTRQPLVITIRYSGQLFLVSTCEREHMVLVFLCLAYFAYHNVHLFYLVAANDRVSLEATAWQLLHEDLHFLRKLIWPLC